MALTQADILRLSEPVELMYMDCTSQLIINLCSHFADGKTLALDAWEVKKLSELGALTEESAAIIAQATGQKTDAIRASLSAALEKELGGLDAVLAAAAKAGAVQGAATSWQASEGVRVALQNLVGQAVDDTNIVNTVMLNSTRERYLAAILTVKTEERELIEQLQGARTAAELEQQLAKTQRELNRTTLSVATGTEARDTAVRRAIKQLATEGITGYIDKGGHHWTPEAYVNMDIRTTVHNAAIQGQRARSADFGVYTFQVSSHAAARPLCAPYQGKFYSWDGSSGVVEDLHGGRHSYESIQSTSYGEPAGLFGINCGHMPQTFISGYSVPRYEPTQDDAENARLYQLTQEQRHLEREIRAAKTEALAYDAAGDKAAFDAKALEIKQYNAKYRDFCKANDLTPRSGRTQVVGYNRSVSGKANAATRRV